MTPHSSRARGDSDESWWGLAIACAACAAVIATTIAVYFLWKTP